MLQSTLQSVGGELPCEHGVDEHDLRGAVDDVEQLAGDELGAVRRVPAAVVEEELRDGRLVLPLHLLVGHRRHHSCREFLNLDINFGEPLLSLSHYL